MPFARPTIPELRTRIEADFVSQLELEAPLLRRALVKIMATVWAGAVYLLYGAIEFVLGQIFPDRSEGYYLRRQAAVYGFAPNEAGFAQGPVAFTGTDGAGVGVGVVLVRLGGSRYETIESGIIAGGEVTLNVRAQAAGLDGNADDAQALTLESPPPNVDGTATVSGGLVGGADEEEQPLFRDRFLARLREPPQGGSESDYIAWARMVAGVTRVWVYPGEAGAGSVVVRFVRDAETPIIPSPAEVAEVQAYLDTVRPVTANVIVVAPTDLPINYDLAVTPDTPEIRIAIEAELRNLHSGLAPGVAVPHSAIVAAVQAGAASESGDTVPAVIVTVPAGDVVPAAGELPTLGTITYT